MIRKSFLTALLAVSCILGFHSLKAQNKIKVACVGNSITEGYGLGDSTYPKYLQRMMGDRYEVRNYGLGGRTLLKKGDHPYWNEPAFKEVQQWQPDLVVIMLGTNDSKPWNWKYKEEFEPDYDAFVQTFKQLPSHPQLYVCYPVPVFKDNYGIRDSVVRFEEPPFIRYVADKEQVHLIDLYKAMQSYGKYFPDGVHPDKIGAGYMAKAVYKKIKHYRRK
jgi:lysophospholipase L1-like esterase